MSLIGVKSVFLFIVALNVFMSVFFWNISQLSSQKQALNQPTIVKPDSLALSNTTISKFYTAAHGKDAKIEGSDLLSAGHYLKKVGKPTYLGDGDEKNYGDFPKAFVDFKSMQRLKELGVTLNKATYTKGKVNQFIQAMQDKLNKRLKQVRESFAPNKLVMQTKYDATKEVMNKLKGQLAIANPFRSYDLYPSILAQEGQFKKTLYSIRKDPGYCDLVDFFNLYHPENIYDAMNFVTDYTNGSLVRKMIQDIGSDTMPEIQYDMKKANVAKYDMNKIANMFYFNRSNPHFYWEISKNYLCMTQSYGHIPGFLSLARTDFSLKLMNGYAKKYENNKKCFDMDRFIPTTYRLNDPDECTEFFEIINSDHYKKFREADKIMFLLKSLTLESKHPRGVYLFDEKEEINLRRQLKEGKGCKDFKNAIVIQKYITSPLLLNKYQNFELKTYMLVSSVQPLIVYYHDGLAHLSSKSYQQNSIGKNAQFTDEDKKIDHKLHKEYYKDMTETEFKESLTWSMEKLVKNLVDTKNINDTNWLNSYLRPKIQEAFTHLIRISQQGFFKHPGVWELFEVSFLLDENLKVWYIKSKISPIVDGATQVEKKFMANMLKDMLDIQFAYLRSRFKKLQEFLSILLEQTAQVARVDKNAVKVVFEEINRNSLEKEFKIAANNSFTLIMDKNIKGIEGFMGHLKTDCFENADKE